MQFADDVERLTDGSLRITVHPAGSLVEHDQIKRAVQTGQVQIGETFVSLLSNEDPTFAVDSIPFLATSYDQAEMLYKAQRPVLEEKLAEDNIRFLYAVPWPPQGLYTQDEVSGIEDMQGVKFRAYNNQTSRLAELMGATPTQIEVPELSQAFSTGIVSSMITSPTTGVNSQAWDFVDYFYNVQAWVPKNMIYVRQQAFNALSTEEQQAVLFAAGVAQERGWQMSRMEANTQIDTLADNGMNVVRDPADSLMSDLQEIGSTMTDEWLEDAGSDGEAIISAYEDMMSDGM
jgi:TRAP-type C4-dicarboxylate transport system substrate-binding protein